MDNLTIIQKLAYESVMEIIDTKQGAVIPCVAHINEIRNSINIELTEALRELCRRGVLGVCVDVNKNPMFSIKRRL